MADNWYYAQGQQRVGPMPLDELARRLPNIGGAGGLVYGPGMQNGAGGGDVPALARAAGGGYAVAPAGGPPPIGAGGGAYGRPQSHEIDLEIFGNEMQYCVCTLDGGETVLAEP